MKYGLMYYKSTDNIGDDIQTYVAMKYLPHIDYYIDREALSCFVPDKREYVSMIMNGWYIHNKIAWPPSPYINPLLISMHFKELEETDVGDSYLKGFGGEFLKKYGPVGARDIDTKNRLERNGIASYFSGCMTLTLEKFEGINKKDKICVVDVEDNIINKIKDSTSSEIEVLTHYLDSKETERKSVNERMEDVENLLKKYQEAKLVITSRLHVALPCVALGTPSIVLHKKVYDKDRLGVFLEYVDSYVQEDFMDMNIHYILQNPKPNNEKYIDMRNDINKRCKEFIERCENEEFNDLVELPNVEKYKKYVKNIEWYKNIYEKERLALERLESKRVEEFRLYHKELDRLSLENVKLLENNELMNNEVINSEAENMLLKQELSNIYNSRGWRYLEKLRRYISD